MKALFLTKPYVIDPLGIAYLGSYLKAAGHEVALALVDNKSEIAKHGADMLCYSVTTGTHTFYQQFNEDYRKTYDNEYLSVFGGPHVTFFPEFAKEPFVDVGVRGEGFQAIINIANAYDRHQPIEELQNVVIGDRVNPLRESMDKSLLLKPDRDLIYKFPENYFNPIKNVMCSFYCPMNCHYCFNEQHKEMYGIRRSQIRPVNKVMEEIDDLMRFPLELLFFQDDLFPIYNRAWIEEFVSSYQFGIPFHIQVRVEYIKEDIVKMLKGVGLHGLTFAIESGNEDLRRNTLGRHTANYQIIRAADILHKYDVKLRTENMIGFPGETWDTAMETVELNAKCHPTIGWASVFQPYPGTVLGDKCIEEALYKGDFSDIDESFFETHKLNVKESKQFESLQKLFSLFVKHPALRHMRRLLCWLPFRRIYRKVFKWHKERLYKRLYSVAKEGQTDATLN